MTNIRVMVMGESTRAKTLLGGQDAIQFVGNLDDAEFILQDAAVFRAAQHPPRTVPIHDLTRREVEVLRLTAEGHSVRQVASMLGLSAKTVDAHKVNLMRKLQIHNKAHLVQYAFRNRILSLEEHVVPSFTEVPLAVAS